MVEDNPNIQTILAELRDTNKGKRRTAVMKLGMHGGDEALRALIRTVDNSNEDLIVRGRAALLLGKFNDQRAVAPLIRALDAPGYQTPLNAVQSLGLLGDDRAVEPLMLIVENGRDKIRDAAIEALQRLGHDHTEETEEILEPTPEI